MDAKLSVWSSYYVEMSPEDAVLEMKKHGILCSELSDEHGLMLLERGDAATVGAQFRAFLDREQFTMTQGHLWLRVRLCTDPDALDRLVEWVTLYEAIGVENAVLHCDSLMELPDLTTEERLNRNAAVLLQLQERMKGMKIRICLENLTRICRSADELVSIVDRLDPDHFGICLDTGHLNMCEQSQTDFIRKSGHRLHALHIADNEGERDQHMMPFGRGNVDFAAVIQALREVNYQGLFNLEIPGERLAPLPVLGYKLEYIRKCYDYLMSV